MCSIMGYCSGDADFSLFKAGFDKTLSRGPDDSRIVDTGHGLLGFHRLSIMGLEPSGMQPFALDGSYVVCNGEIYGFEALKRELLAKGYSFRSESDCEVLLPLYREHGTNMFRMLDAEFALILYDAQKQSFIAARDPIGIRPLYYGYDDAGAIVFASEPKNLVGICGKIMPFPPGHYYADGKFVCYRDITAVKEVCRDDVDTVCANIHKKLVAGIRKRLVADAKVGFLLSGGLDSSLVCAVAQRCSDTPIRTFAIGMSEDAIDLKYAREVADYIGSDHTEVYMTPDEVRSSLETVIELLGSLRALHPEAKERAMLEEQVGRGERQATGVAKAPFVAAFVRALLDNGEKVLLFAHHHAVMDVYKKELASYRPAFITGRETTQQKDDAVTRFMGEKTNLCVISLRAASGLNLQRASCVVFGELDWSPAVHSQAEDRAHRMGQKDSILCYYLVAPQGSDRDMQDALGLKVSQFVALMGDKTPALSSVQDAQQAAKAHIEKMLKQYDAAQTNDRV